MGGGVRDDGDDPYNLKRFIDAHGGDYERACEELKRGRKETHWMWYIFPQIAGLGRSQTSVFYAIRSLDEARAYLAHPVLGPRLEEVTTITLENHELFSAHQIFDTPDDLKFHSSMTLFAHVSPAGSVYARAIHAYFDGKPDEQTIKLAG